MNSVTYTVLDTVSDTAPVYDRIGIGYSTVRRPDPRWAAAIRASLGGARTVLNLGAGSGAYEPDGVRLIAIEPSREMRAQRGAGSAPCIAGQVESLPFDDQSFDVVMAVLTVHHWADLDTGIRELLRVAHRFAVVSYDMDVQADYWFTRDYVPEIAEAERSRVPSLERVTTTSRPLRGHRTARVARLHGRFHDRLLAAAGGLPGAGRPQVLLSFRADRSGSRRARRGTAARRPRLRCMAPSLCGSAGTGPHRRWVPAVDRQLAVRRGWSGGCTVSRSAPQHPWTIAGWDYDRLVDVVGRHGTPVQVLDAERLDRAVRELLAALGALIRPARVHYSVKTNYLPYLCRRLAGQGMGADVVSGYEMDAALAADSRRRPSCSTAR